MNLTEAQQLLAADEAEGSLSASPEPDRATYKQEKRAICLALTEWSVPAANHVTLRIIDCEG